MCSCDDAPVPEYQWFVRIHDDDTTSAMVALYLLHRLCGVAWPQAAQLTVAVQREGFADVAACASRDEAEGLVVALQRGGLRATLRCR